MAEVVDRKVVLADIIRILGELREDWSFEGELGEKTGLFGDLHFESIDAVALGSAIESHYNQSLPFAEFLTKAGERQAKDIYIGEMVEFLAKHIKPEMIKK